MASTRKTLTPQEFIHDLAKHRDGLAVRFGGVFLDDAARRCRLSLQEIIGPVMWEKDIVDNRDIVTLYQYFKHDEAYHKEQQVEVESPSESENHRFAAEQSHFIAERIDFLAERYYGLHRSELDGPYATKTVERMVNRYAVTVAPISQLDYGRLVGGPVLGGESRLSLMDATTAERLAPESPRVVGRIRPTDAAPTLAVPRVTTVAVKPAPELRDPAAIRQDYKDCWAELDALCKTHGLTRGIVTLTNTETATPWLNVKPELFTKNINEARTTAHDLDLPPNASKLLDRVNELHAEFQQTKQVAGKAVNQR